MRKFFEKRLIALLLALAMVFSVLPLQVFADEAEEPVVTENPEQPVDGKIAISDVAAKLPARITCNHKIVEDEEVPALCEETGLTAGSHCSLCGETFVAQQTIPALGHDIMLVDAKLPSYGSVGWDAYEKCTRCSYSTYVEIPGVPVPPVEDYETFLFDLMLLEELAYMYAMENPGKDPCELVIKYIRTGVDRYNSGSWGIMAGYEDAGFAAFVQQMQDMVNTDATCLEEMISVTSLKDIRNFHLPNGDYVDIGHMFGTMDITYHNNYGTNHADVAGWAGDLVDLLSLSDQFGTGDAKNVEEMVAYITENYFLENEYDLTIKYGEEPKEGTFSITDLYGDLDGFYVCKKLEGMEYENGSMANLFMEYFTEELTLKQRMEYFMEHRLDGFSTRSDLRAAVYNAYTGNRVVATLESTREFESSDLSELRKACCYAVADYICKIAGDYVNVVDNPYYTVFSSETAVLAPGITQNIKLATTADGKQMAYYIAIADLKREDVDVYANYNNNDPAAGWAMQRVLDQANAAQNKYGNPESEHYIENYNVIASINGDGYNMTTGKPGGLLVMNGVEYHPVDGNGFFGILKDGTPVIGTMNEYNTTYKDQVRDAIGGFGTTLVKNGKVVITATSNYYTDRASRTAVGITATGKVVFMVLDGRQEPFSCGGSMIEIAQIMQEAGCVHAINLDGGGSTTFVAKQPGEEELRVINSPSDGFARSVATTLMMVSTAPSSTAFDHAVLEMDTNYLTVGSTMQITASGVSATGNSVPLPEGTTWEVSNAKWGKITEDGVFTALRNGNVEVYLMLDGQVIASKTMNIVIPTGIYFTKESINAVYGQSVELPVKAQYEGKNVAINLNDLSFALSNELAGQIEGFTFTAAASANVKNVKIVAYLNGNPDAMAVISVALYNQGELSFDFDQAIGGDRQMAWDRVVTNATTEDNKNYEVIDPDADMSATYTLAIDMTQIPFPQQLNDLIYMLPGADAENASAWNFLLQLAERISVLTEVTPTIRFDPNVEVDYSNMKLVTDYFTLTETVFDEETNTLTLKLNWIDQTKAIDPETANPLCIVSGVKITPKADAQWDANNKLTIVNEGEIGYEIYMRASALYSFAQKPENQAIYGLMPFVNPDLPSEKGGYFSSVYNTFRDEFTLVDELKNGWYNVDGGYAYYVDGKECTGICKVDGRYYDFGTEGVNVGKTPYTGLFEEDGALYYSRLGELTSGWFVVKGNYYYFNPNTFRAHTGVSKIGNQTYTFGEDGKLLKGAFVQTAKGLRYYWAGTLVARAWIETEDGKLFANDSGYITFGNYPVLENATEDPIWMHFDETTGIFTGICDGFVQYDGATYYCENGVWYYGAVRTEGGIVFCGSNGMVRVNGSCYVSSSLEVTADLETGYYWCDADGYIQANGFATISGVTYYFVDYVRAKGFVKIGEDYYFFNASNGKMYKNVSLWVGGSNPYGIPAGYYDFMADGKMYMPDPNGEKRIVEENGKLYFTIDGMKQKNGLNEKDGEYYYANGSGVLARNETIWVSQRNDLISETNGYFAFDKDGKMVKTGFVTGGGATYYYDNIVRVKGFTKIGENYYFFNASSGKMYANTTLWVGANNGYGLPSGYYDFKADGKMYVPDPNGEKRIVEENGKLYFTIDGVKQKNGLNELNGEYYYAQTNGILARNQSIWVSQRNGLISETNGYYAFDKDGKLIKTGFATGGGATYYYDNIVRVKGFTKIGNDYYFFNAGSGKMYTNTTLWVAPGNPYGIEKGYYNFMADGKMYIPDPNGEKRIVEENGKLYFTVDGVKQKNGLNELNGEYYYAQTNGVLARNQSIWVSQRNDLIEETNGYYAFDQDGKLIKTGFATGGGYTYYYKDLVRVKGFTKIGEDYYFFNAGSGKMNCNVKLYVGPNSYGIAKGYYYFAADGKMVID